ncbi:MAG TPA: hypothetical protein EYG98_00605 [Sulfurovum sp.]|nr:hypothetical protein [Sulfurovum sp.]
MKKLFLLCILLIFIEAKNENCVIIVDDIPLVLCPNKPKLLFSSGFEDDVYIDPYIVENSEDYAFIRGKDKETGFSWPINILGATESALHHIDDDDLKAVEAEIQTLTDDNGKENRVLYNKQNYVLNGENGATQYPYEILNIKEGKSDLYISYRMKIDNGMVGKIDKWRALFEYKTKDYKDPGEGGTGFRLIAYVYTDKQGRPSWHFQGDKDYKNPIWECDTLLPTAECHNSNVPVVFNDWFLTEFYWHWSDGADGKVVWKINGKVVGEHHGPTTRGSNPIDFIILTQIYGNSNPKEQWIDDIEIWDGLPK